MESQQAFLALADGTLVQGRSVGAPVESTGELVFNTAMSGYQEILTDPSYCRQIVTFTAPHIGNVGCNDEDAESGAVQVAGVVMRDLSLLSSNWRSERDLSSYLRDQGVPAVVGVDTRMLTTRLREQGAQGAALVAGGGASAERAQLLAARFAGLQGQDLAKVVTTDERYEWQQGTWSLGQGFGGGAASRYRVVAYDFGVKRNLLRLLAQRGCRVTVVPAHTTASEVLEMAPDGVFLSNGPGDPQPCDYAIVAIRELLAANVPLFGICLGHQLLALAAGARTRKMKFGHHGANHPVQDLATGAVMITSQNHGFVVDEDSLPQALQATHRSLFDGSLQGFRHLPSGAFGFQGHPEASPGPHDVEPLFDEFIALMERRLGVRGN